MSSSPSIFDIAFNPPPAHPSTIFPGLTGSRVAPPQPSHNPHGPPRLSSPRLFRDFFSDLNGSSQGRQSNAPRLPLFRERGELDPAQLAGAIARTSRAVEGVQEAFQPRWTESGHEVVDLTESPPEPQAERQGQAERDATAVGSHSRGGAESDYLSRTTHPLDRDSARRPSRARGVNTLNEPVFGYQPIFTPDNDSAEEDWTDSINRARARRAHVAAHRHYHHPPRPRNTEREEREAVRRQRENHAAWQRTQARTRLLQANQQAPRSLSPTPSISDSSDASPTPSISSISSSNMSKSNMSRNQASRTSGSPIEAVDLTAVDSHSAVAATLAKQRADAIAAQRPDTATENGRTTLTAYKCPVCMETPVNATTTVCGHLFCHQCIIETLQWSAKNREEQAVGPRKKHGMCPVCRKLLAIKDVPGQGRTLVTLELRFTTKKRKADDDPKGKGKAKDDSDSKENRGRSKRVKREKRENTDEQLWGNFINPDVA